MIKFYKVQTISSGGTKTIEPKDNYDCGFNLVFTPCL